MDKSLYAMPDHQPPWMSDRMWLVLTMRAQQRTWQAIGAELGHKTGEGAHRLWYRARLLLRRRRERGIADDYDLDADRRRELEERFGDLLTIFPHRQHGAENLARVVLARAGHTSRADLATTPDRELLKIHNFGKASLARLRERVPFAGDGG